MTRRKTLDLKWTVVLIIVIYSQCVCSRPQESSTIVASTSDPLTTTEHSIRSSTQQTDALKSPQDSVPVRSATANTPRDVKAKGPAIRDSIKLVANQLLENISNASAENPIVTDSRIPPKVKTQLAHKHKIKIRNDDEGSSDENSHAGVAVPVIMDDLETENKVIESPNESSTSNEGISTWILLSSPNKENATSPTEPTRLDDTQKKNKPTANKNKVKRPQATKPVVKRPIIGSTNKSDLIAGGSAMNENVYNKIKDTVLSNVQKNKLTVTQRLTTTSSTTPIPTTESLITKKETSTKVSSPANTTTTKLTPKPTKKKNKNKQKTTTTESPIVNESALLPMEPKEQEIELEVSTPPTTTKKPKRSSSKKKNKTKKRKTSTKTKTDTEANITEVNTSNKTKSTKPSKKPTSVTGPITSQIYNYFSREVMPSVGVGVIGLAGLVGLASYFLYPFATPVRRTFEVDKKDDIYRHNAEEYASEGNGQAEEEMLGTVLAGMPAHAKNKLNPYAGQTSHINRYPVKNEQDIRYRHVAPSYDPKYSARYPQQKTGIAHGAVYPASVHYNSPQYETRHVYTTETNPNMYNVYDKAINYTPYPAVEPIYAAPQSGPSSISSYGNDASNSVVYGVKPSSETDFKPVYPFEGQFHSESTANPNTYPSTSMYLGSNNDSEDEEVEKYSDESSRNGNDEGEDNKYVVGNVPKDFVDSATPVAVPEHGPRKITRRKRSIIRYKRSINSAIDRNIEDILLKESESRKDIFMSNEIDETPVALISNLEAPETHTNTSEDETGVTVNYQSSNVQNETTTPFFNTDLSTNTDLKTEIIESVSTQPIESAPKATTETEMSNELDLTTRPFKVYEVFPSASPENEVGKEASTSYSKEVTTTQSKSENTETTTETRSEIPSTLTPSPTPIYDGKEPITSTVSFKPKPTDNPEILTYPPPNQEGGFFSFLKRLIEFKYRLGLSILQTTSDSLNKYLRNMENQVHHVAKASKV